MEEQPPHENQWSDLTKHISSLLQRGIAEGHFRFTVQISPKSSRKHRIVVEAGTSEQFVVRLEDIKPQHSTTPGIGAHS